MVNILLEFQGKLPLIALMLARITPIFLLLPIFNQGIISSIVVRNAIMVIIVIGLWPVIDTDLPLLSFKSADYAVLAAKEGVIGAAMGFAMALPFWMFSALGSYVDMARGASMGSLVDPTNGQESTETANLINYCVIAVYLQLGGMHQFLEILVQSYRTIGLSQGFTVDVEQVMSFLGHLIKEGFILASPVLLMLLLTESLLGLFSRFTPQLNAFSVSLTIKSVIAFFILMMYFWQVLPEKLAIYMTEYSSMQLLKIVN